MARDPETVTVITEVKGQTQVIKVKDQVPVLVPTKT